MSELDLPRTQGGEDGAGTMQTHIAFLVRYVPGKDCFANSYHMCRTGAAGMMRR